MSDNGMMKILDEGKITVVAPRRGARRGGLVKYNLASSPE